MRKTVTALVAFVATLGLLTVAHAKDHLGPVCSNARAEFVDHADRAPDLDGHAIINYAKGADKWNVDGRVEGLEPDTDYVLQVGLPGEAGSDFRQNVATFTTNKKGRANLNGSAEPELDKYGIVRIIDPSGNENPGVGGTIVGVAVHDDGKGEPEPGSLEFRGTNRCKDKGKKKKKKNK